MSLGFTQGSLLSSGVAWTPASLPNLLAWYKADTGVYSDAGVTLATNTQYLSTGFNSKQTVKFTAATPTGMLTSTGLAIGTGTTASGFFVGQMLTGTVSFGRAIVYGPPADQDYSSGGRVWALRDDTNNAIEGYNGSPFASQAVSLATNIRWGIVYDGVNGTSYLYNANPTASAVSSSIVSAGAIGVGIEVSFGNFGGTAGWDGPISEVVITTSAMSAGDRSSLDSYFQTKWGL